MSLHRLTQMGQKSNPYIQESFNASNTDGSFTVADSNPVLSPEEIHPIALENKYLGMF